MVERYGLRIIINNNKNGNRGAIFYFTLPLSKVVGTSNNNTR